MESINEASVIGHLAVLQAKMVLAMIDDDNEPIKIDIYREAYMEMPEEFRLALDAMESRRVMRLTKRAISTLTEVAEA